MFVSHRFLTDYWWGLLVISAGVCLTTVSTFSYTCQVHYISERGTDVGVRSREITPVCKM